MVTMRCKIDPSVVEIGKHVSRNSIEAAPERAIDDLALVHACKSGDVSAFEELVKRYDTKLLRIACHITHNQEDAEEAVQDAFLKAYIKLDQFEEKASFSTWLTRIAVNESIAKLRKHRTTDEHLIPIAGPEEGIPIDVADWTPNPEQLYSATELRRTLLKSLDSLSPALRVVFVLRDITGLSGEETAEVLKLALPAVKARLFRARLQLRERLSKHFKKRPTSHRRPERTTEIAESDGEPTAGSQKINGPFLARGSDLDPNASAMYELLTEP